MIQERRAVDVVIAGDGASGWILAALVATHGLRVAVLGQHFQQPRDERFHGIVTSAALDALGLGPPPAAVLYPIERLSRFALPDRMANDMPGGGAWGVRHSDLLSWLRGIATEGGVVFEPRATVTDVVWEGGSISGAVCAGERMRWDAPLVVLADGSDPRVAERLGLRPDWPPTQLMHVGKQRFRRPDSRATAVAGAAAVIAGFTSWGDAASGLLAPGVDGTTLVVCMLLEDEMRSARHIREAMDEVREHLIVDARLGDLERAGFVTDVIPVGGVADPPRLTSDGIMVVGDTAGLTHPLNRDGLAANVDVVRLAATTILDAARVDDWSSVTLARFDERVRDTVVDPLRRRARAASLPDDRAWIVSSGSDPVDSLASMVPFRSHDHGAGPSGTGKRPVSLRDRVKGLGSLVGRGRSDQAER